MLAQSVSGRLLNGSGEQQMELYSVKAVQLSRPSSSGPPDHQGFCLAGISTFTRLTDMGDQHHMETKLESIWRAKYQPSNEATVTDLLQKKLARFDKAW